MATPESREVNRWFRDYCDGIFAAIGRNDLRSQINAPINTDIQMQSAADEIRIAELSIITEWSPEMEPFWAIAQDQFDLDFQPEAAGGQVPDSVWANYLLLLEDDFLAKLYYKTLRRLVLRALQVDLFNQSQA